MCVNTYSIPIKQWAYDCVNKGAGWPGRNCLEVDSSMLRPTVIPRANFR